MPHANAPARSNMARTRTNANNSYARAGNGHTYSNNTHTGSKAKAALATSGPVNPGTGTTGTVNARTTNTALVGTPGTFNRSTAALGGATSTNLTNPAGFSPNTYTYGQGTGIVPTGPTVTVLATVTDITGGDTGMVGRRATTARLSDGYGPCR